jgi:hypothetical protein
MGDIFGGVTEGLYDLQNGEQSGLVTIGSTDSDVIVSASSVEQDGSVRLRTSGVDRVVINQNGGLSLPSASAAGEGVNVLLFDDATDVVTPGALTELRSTLGGVALKTAGQTRMAVSNAGVITMANLNDLTNPTKFVTYDVATGELRKSDAAPGVKLVDSEPSQETYNQAVYLNQASKTFYAYDGPLTYEVLVPSASWNGGTTRAVTDAATWISQIAACVAGDTVSLSNSITLTAQYVSSVSGIRILGNGYTITVPTNLNAAGLRFSGSGLLFSQLQVVNSGTGSNDACLFLESTAATDNRISQCTFTTNEFGVTSSNAGVSIFNCTFAFTGTADSHRYILLSRVTAPTIIDNCTFAGNGINSTQCVFMTSATPDTVYTGATLQISNCSSVTNPVQRLLMLEAGCGPNFDLVIKNNTLTTTSGFVIFYDRTRTQNLRNVAMYGNTEVLGPSITGSKGLLGFDAPSGLAALNVQFKLHAFSNTVPTLRADFATAVVTTNRTVAFSTVVFTAPASLLYENPGPILIIPDTTAFLTAAQAALTYQTISGMSAYLTTSAAASTYQTQAGMSNYYDTTSSDSRYLRRVVLVGGSSGSNLTVDNLATTNGLTTLGRADSFGLGVYRCGLALTGSTGDGAGVNPLSAGLFANFQGSVYLNCGSATYRLNPTGTWSAPTNTTLVTVPDNEVRASSSATANSARAQYRISNSNAVGAGVGVYNTGSLNVGAVFNNNNQPVYQWHPTERGPNQCTFVGFTAGNLATTSTGDIYIHSDVRVKHDIQDYQPGLREISLLRPRKFRLNADPYKNYAGFIAQEVEDIIPEAVDCKKYDTWYQVNEDGSPKRDADGNVICAPCDEDPRAGTPRYRSFDSMPIVAALVKAVQELDERVNVLTGKKRDRDGNLI